MITYEIVLPLSGKKIVFNLLDSDYTYVIDTIQNSPASRQLPVQAKKNMWIIAINGEEPVTSPVALDELN